MIPKKIIVAISGSIAAYKSALLVRGLIKNGHEVKVVMTSSACDFISPLTLSTLSKNQVFLDVSDGESWNNHVELGLWADLMIVAPATANTIAKMATGICDNMLLATYLSAKCPVWIAPAMDLDMWQHPTTRSNIDRLKTFNAHKVLNVGDGELASGLHGPGRMAEPDNIVAEVESWFISRNELDGIKALVTAGPTYEYIDPVRFIGNPSSGKMGIALAHELAARGARVDLILGPVDNIQISDSVNVTKVKSAQEMYDACEALFNESHLSIFAAAVADYTPSNRSETKIKKGEDDLNLSLTRTPDIAGLLGTKKRGDQTTIGFALETDSEEINALSKLERKNFNFIVLNSLQDHGAGFGLDTNKITIYDDADRQVKFETKSKISVAKDIIDHYCKFYKK